MTDEYAKWRAYLAMERNVETIRGEPCAGFWRVRYGAHNEWTPLATFPHEGRMIGVILGRQVDPVEFWPVYARRPISESVYRAVADRGEPWPKHPQEELTNV